MQAENWKKVKEILREAMQIEPPARRAFLDEAAPSAEIRAEVESLLAFEAETEDFMSLSITDFSKDFLAIEEAGQEEEKEEAESPVVGRKIGIYKILSELGAGGMGAVYLAERADGKFAQLVAVKMLRREFNIEKIRRSFEREREIQSKLNHPNIARLFDAGTTRDGLPFLVMEYVEGLPIDKFCRENSLALTERLKLFNKVCAAVAFAHRNLIIHRDLKPSNILVTADGEPKLLDFGISKLLDAQAKEANTITLLGAMTPEYASPEQIKGEQVTTATDIYSLGVVLHKILTGRHPFDSAGKTNGELLKAIGETKPAPPSSLKIEDDGRRKISASELKGDLDNIILKALRKEPERRYETVERFSADIWRFVDGMPVLARRPTFSYQASKFFRRNKIFVFAGLLILASIFAGLAVAVWQANEARAQAQIAFEAQRRAELETEKAKAEEEKAEKISRFMNKIISYANPAWYAEGGKFVRDARVIDVLDDMGAKIDVEFAGQPDIQSELHHQFAEVYTFHGRGNSRAAQSHEKQVYHARRAIELRKQFYGERHELVAKDMYYFYISGGVAKADEAKYLAEAIQMLRETNPKNLNLPYMLEAYTARMMLPGYEESHEKYLQAVIPPTSENKYRIAERYLLEALPVFREHYKEDNIAIFLNECKLAYAQIMQNKFAEAEPHHRICRESVDKLQNEDHAKLVRNYLSQIEAASAGK
ncbi:MAG TPA: serine/threonine-protein kinase [Pyrinomonadaceae bacterium]|jgi:serine/threonine protein kinase